MKAKTIAIIGGGPAGAFAGAQLARHGREVLIFDDKLAWEKPCGGGLTPKAIQRWPFLRDAVVERNLIADCEITSPSGKKVRFPLASQIAIFSRLTLNDLVLKRARESGAQVLRERVLQIDGGPGGWVVKSKSSEYRADFLVLATGARNPFRAQFAEPLGADDFVVAMGYFIPGTRKTVQIRFLPGLHGYIWIFPRADHFSAGICGRMQGRNSGDLRAILDRHIPEFGLSLDGAQFYAHIIPSLSKNALQRSTFAGENWAMVGDAAGFVDAVTGEGLYYALRSAELLAEALVANQPANYAQEARREIIAELEFAAGIAGRFYSGEWLGGPVLERMVGLTARSSSFRKLMRDLFAGSQEYSGLKKRVHRTLPWIAAETVASALWWTGGQPLAS
jgi:flavin-dependent dehydrogenase